MIKAICHITTVHGPFDSRIFQKECRSAAKLGFDVFEVAPHHKNEIVDGVQVIGIKKYKGRFRRIFLGPWSAFRKALSTKAKVCHFHDPELMPIGILLALFGRKVIYDTHEVFPAQVMGKDWLGPRWVRKLIAIFSAGLEKFSALFFSNVIGAIEEGANRFGKKGIVIKNVPVLDLVKKAEPKKLPKEKPVVIFSGGIFRMKGIYHLIEAFEYLEGEAELWLLGKWESDKFRKECEQLKGYSQTKYLGLVHPDEVFSYMKSADIGASTFLPVPNYLQNFPIKAFEYLACGLPIIMSNFPYYMKHFTEGAVFADPEDPRALADQVRKLLADADLRKAMGEKGKAWVLSTFNWSIEEKKLGDLYCKLLGYKPTPKNP